MQSPDTPAIVRAAARAIVGLVGLTLGGEWSGNGRRAGHKVVTVSADRGASCEVLPHCLSLMSPADVSVVSYLHSITQWPQ